MSKKLLVGLGLAGALGGYHFYIEHSGCTYKGEENLKGQAFILTGATNPGIGKETARELAKRGAKVILAAKNQDRCHQARQHIMHSTKYANHDVDCADLDLKSLKSVRKFVDELPADLQLKGLINAAETVKKHRREETHDGLEKQMGVSHFGHFLLTNLLVEKYGRSSPFRVTAVTYPAGSVEMRMEDLNSVKSYDRDRVYRQAKLATLYTIYSAAFQVGAFPVRFFAVNPGPSNTEVFRHVCGDKSFIIKVLLQPLLMFLFPSAEKAAQPILYTALSPQLDNLSGSYVENCTPKEMPIGNRDLVQAKRLWQISQEVVADPKAFVAAAEKAKTEA
ncbi:retinol dehydrogenase 13-like [Paramacrobiotus metropolitanus]|uniref:retinol dehydrogenase 13-like n=1 Tax=Paramacrobiotus metropolitanus TaxID=2943436 RepID=UPI0024463B7A|nr:retinol dehydrogenase 13-like [Paramacrobiotus metropolitanus]